jgi:hypothetical protein
VNLDSYPGDVIPLGAEGLSSTVDANDARERGISVTTRSKHKGRVHRVYLAGFFRINPIVGFKNCYTRLQEGKIISMVS